MNNDFTIANEYTLPSEGKVYSNKDVTSQIKLRSMTTAEEMKRLNHSERPYKAIAEIMNDCLVEKIGIDPYDLCIPDFQYVLHNTNKITFSQKNSPKCFITHANSKKAPSTRPLCSQIHHFQDYTKNILSTSPPYFRQAIFFKNTFTP